MKRRGQSSRPAGSTRECPVCDMRVSTDGFDRHHAECLRLHAALERLKAASRPTELEKESRTHDGYRIDHCPLCHRRVCLVPDGTGSNRTHEIVQTRMGERHVCDGMTSGGRRSQLFYASSQAGVLKRSGGRKR